MPEARFLKIVILSLLLLNLGTLGYLWLGSTRAMHHPPPPPGGGDQGPEGRRGAAAFLHEALQLTESQEAAYKTLRNSHHATMLSIRGEMKDCKQDLYALLKATDRTSVLSSEHRWLDSLAAKQRRIETITYEHFRDLRMLCTPAQQTKFDVVIGEALEQMR